MKPGAVQILVAITIVFVATIGLGPLAIIPLLLAVVVVIWFVVALLRSGGAPSRVLHRTRKADLLGPGGPDDPDA
jgi:hypothetical protein